MNLFKIAALAAILYPSACFGARAEIIKASDAQALARYGISITRIGMPGKAPTRFDIRLLPSLPAKIRIRDKGRKGSLVAIAAPKGADTKFSVYVMEAEAVTEVSFLFYPPERPEAFAIISVDVNLSVEQGAETPDTEAPDTEAPDTKTSIPGSQ